MKWVLNMNETDTFVGDLNKDGKVNILDITIVARAFGTEPGDPHWNPVADVNGDGIVNILDVALVAREFGHQNAVTA